MGFKKIIMIVFLIPLFLHLLTPTTIEDVLPIYDNRKIYFGSEKIKLSELNDPLFTHDEYSYSHMLAVESLKLSYAAFSSDAAREFWGDNRFCGRENNVMKYLSDAGYNNIEFYGYDVSLNNTSSKAAFSVGQKIYNHSTVIVVIAVRGGGYGLEWSDNFNLGSTDIDYHLGFYTSAEKIKEQTDKYIDNLKEYDNIKLWITGYSRGGAIANILAAMYDEDNDGYTPDIYAYTFAAPRTVINSENRLQNDVYNNIFNIISTYDPVYNIPPSEWGFSRFGINVKIPSDDFENEEYIKKSVAAAYNSYTGKQLYFNKSYFNIFLDIVVKVSDNRDFYNKYLYEPLSDFVIVKMMKDRNEDGKWSNIGYKESIERMYGVSAVNIYNNMKNNIMFRTANRLKINIPDDYLLFISLCHIHGFKGIEKKLFSDIKVSDLESLSCLASGDDIYTYHSPYYYLSWLENAPESVFIFEKQ